MGRKGIGKLALFSIAEVIEVHTVSGKEKHSFRMVTSDIRNAIKAKLDYHPTPIAFNGPKNGTRIILTDLKKGRTGNTASALRKRIARRFSIIGLQDDARNTFRVYINGVEIGPADREDLKSIEFLWEVGTTKINKKDCPLLEGKFKIKNNIVDPANPSWIVHGWLGAAETVKKLKHDEAGTMNGIVVLSRGRLFQENILDKIGYTRILGSYLTGQIEADFLSDLGSPDIATSDRQRIVEDDPRYIKLQEYLKTALIEIQDSWTNLRNEARGKQAITEIPELQDWLTELPDGQQRDIARRYLGIIRSVELDDEEDRKSLYRSGILAFERLRIREESHLLSTIEPTADNLLPLLSNLADMEAALYYDIIKSRMEVIREFEKIVDGKEKEKVLQKHLFKNLWLLDPGWERAARSERMEESLKKEYRDFSDDLTDDESKGRIDIRYMTNAGEHLIIELKRATRELVFDEILVQGKKYRTGLIKCLQKKMGINNPHVSVVFVVGIKPKEMDEEADNALAALNIKYVHYETLIHGALAQYGEYIERSRKKDYVNKIVRKLM
jgi:hypothetical protein